jgi:hypothetical protein
MENLIYKNEEPKFSENSIFSWNEENYLENLHRLDENGLQKLFDETTLDLMLNFKLVVNDFDYSLTECEVYFDDNNIHPDKFIHGDELQSKFMRFFCNNHGGLDLTFGFENEQKIFGAILVRGVYDHHNKEYINGSTTIFWKLFNRINNNFFQNRGFSLRHIDKDEIIKIESINKSTRVNLTKEIPFKEKFQSKLYRYIANIEDMNNDYKEKGKVRSINIKLL